MRYYDVCQTVIYVKATKLNIRYVFMRLSLVAGGAVIAAARAEDASLGCKILLCAAATKPDWSGISYCAAPMNALFSILKKGGAWPACPEGNVSAVQYTPYLACPAGSLAGRFDSGTNDGYGHFIPDSSGGSCLNPIRVQQCQHGACTATYVSQPRSTNPKPYCVEIGASNGSTTTRFCFNEFGA